MRIGSLFSGCGGLDLAVEQALGARTVWHCEIEAAAAKVLAHRWPGVPNLGDVTTIDWTDVEPVEVLCGGFPCQDISNAGKRAGIEGSRSGLWADYAGAIRVLRPRLVVVENVSALLGRGLGRVLGDLAALGYDTRWGCVRASDVGAPHRRERVFITAWPAADSPNVGHEPRRGTRGRRPGPANGGLLPTPTGRDWKGPNQRGDTTCLTGALLPTPKATDGTKGGPGQRGSSGDLMLPSAVTLLPTPSVADAMGGHLTRSGERSDELLLPGVAKELGERLLPTPTAMDSKASGGGNPSDVTLTDATVRRPQDWGQYAAAVHRWEQALGRPAPAPTQLSSKGTPQLSPRFSEWLMGLPEGWVTDVPGITRNQALPILGNGVVPQQAIAALEVLLAADLSEAAS